ncbi:MAG: choice-of-anchor D domain-containing protein [Pyrinomonadaceae bacterium]
MRDERRGRPAARRATVLACGLLAGAGLVAAARAPQETQFQSPAAATIDPSGVDFDEQVVGRWSRAQRVVLTNTGGATLHVNSVTVAGDGAEKYSVVKDTCTGAEVVPYRACIIDIAFLPTAKDDFDAELKITDSAPDSPQTIRVTGEGINSVMLPPGGIGR